MNAELVDAARVAGITGATLYLLGAGVYLGWRAVAWARAAEQPRERARLLARGLLAFVLIHALTLTLGGFALLAVVLGLGGRLPASEREGMARAAWVCLAAGPLLAASAGAGLLRLRRAAV